MSPVFILQYINNIGKLIKILIVSLCSGVVNWDRFSCTESHPHEGHTGLVCTYSIPEKIEPGAILQTTEQQLA